ncbi:hypothetical protein GALMADRAFT_135624 [Galerina marginata CBS 339.88]|uniref:Uncharacterized protein n=1 Tax=Galerina marginata (strain CBS 339.88) TaxID=685588 RepID=A0A067TGB0_GALM3|nr:hypothetical protein GALMADRAFT_135624 [Galerina marginata CBS 339.88]
MLLCCSPKGSLGPRLSHPEYLTDSHQLFCTYSAGACPLVGEHRDFGSTLHSLLDHHLDSDLDPAPSSGSMASQISTSSCVNGESGHITTPSAVLISLLTVLPTPTANSRLCSPFLAIADATPDTGQRRGFFSQLFASVAPFFFRRAEGWSGSTNPGWNAVVGLVLPLSLLGSFSRFSSTSKVHMGLKLCDVEDGNAILIRDHDPPGSKRFLRHLNNKSFAGIVQFDGDTALTQLVFYVRAHFTFSVIFRLLLHFSYFPFASASTR